MNNVCRINHGSSNPEPAIIQINDHVLGFYYGRGLTGESGYECNPDNWINKGAWDLGIANYAVYRDDSALVFDSSTSPECGQWIRNYLNQKHGIRHITVVLSHWHLDHIAGLSAFRDCQIYALDSTAAMIEQNRKAIESGSLWGSPGIPVVMPTHTFSNNIDLENGGIAIKLRHYQIHSRDGLAMLICEDRSLFAGDMLEDPISYIVEPENMPVHIEELARLRLLDVERIFPSHGNFTRIAEGGYGKSLIDTVIEYNSNMMRSVRAPDFHDRSIESMIPGAIMNGSVQVWENYRSVHRDNLKRVYDYWHKI